MSLVCGSCTEREKARGDTAWPFNWICDPPASKREPAEATTEGAEYRCVTR